MCPQNLQRRILLQCFLICDEFDFARIAERTGLSEATVRIYEALYWNVRGRDRIYVVSLVYPETRQIEWAADYALKETPMNLALRATLHGGIAAAEEFLGLKNPVEDSGAAVHARAFASRIMSNANFMAKLGFMNQDMPAMEHALRALRTVKSLQDDVSEKQVDPIGDAMSVAESIRRAFADIERGRGARTGLQPPASEEPNLRRAA
jgi:hypothetical protein